MSRLTAAVSARRLLAVGVGLSPLIAGLLTVPAGANPQGTGLVISEVYGAGGNSGAVVDADFIELYNPTGDDIALNGLSVHYRSASGGSGGSPYALTGTIPASSHYLVQMSEAGSNGEPLPTPDAVANPAFRMAAAGGQVYLLNGATAITASGDMAGNPAVVDMVGATSSATSFEGAPTGTGASATSSLNRSATGADTDDNSADFASADPSPTAGGDTEPPPEPSAVTIAEIQGTNTDVSPYNGQDVTTTGVVTAAYPTGGFNGFYLQTAGTGGSTDATPGASDGVFVYGPNSVGLVEVGQHVEVAGTVTEFAGTTEITRPTVTALGAAPEPVLAAAIAYPRTDEGREAHEGELLAPTDDFTVTNNYPTNQYGEIGLATGTEQLWQPTDRADAQDTAAIAAIEADNAARAVTLDDAASWNYLTNYEDSPLPWLTPDNPVRVGSAVTLSAPVILEYRYDTWRFQPRQQVTTAGRDVATFSDTRSENQAPREVGGDLTLATMNVLNYFDTTGTDWIDAGNACTFYNDRTDDPVTDNQCTGGPIGQGPRGAAESSGGSDLTAQAADLERQRIKIVKAINALDADVVSLEEIENSVALGEADRDGALSSLVQALNADAGSTRWAFAPSPAAADLPPLAAQDVIRTAFIYDPSTVSTVGESEVLVGSEAFSNAREPLAQAFKRSGTSDDNAFAVIVNHFKSKGSGVDDGTGQGNANPDRIAQATALVAFADQFGTDRGTDQVFLTGDFNAYSKEDPIQVLEAAGYANVAGNQTDEVSYQFGGLGGSLDHVLASPSAQETVTGFDRWQVNAEEAVAFEYSRYNYNATLLYQDDSFRSSDHNPALVGIAAASTPEQQSRTKAVATPGSVKARHGKVTIRSTVSGKHGKSGKHGTPTGTVEYWLDGRKIGERRLDRHGRSTAVFGPFARPGRYVVQVRYLGDDTYRGSSDSVRFKVRRSRR